jgi:hypothetical protein
MKMASIIGINGVIRRNGEIISKRSENQWRENKIMAAMASIMKKAAKMKIIMA